MTQNQGIQKNCQQLKTICFFILFYCKNYALQEVMALIFLLSQSRTSEIIHELSPILKFAINIKEISPHNGLFAQWKKFNKKITTLK